MRVRCAARASPRPAFRIPRATRDRGPARSVRCFGMKLGTLLLRNAAIGLSQLEAALRNQVLYGGRLGTNLVELGYIDLELLSAYLAELSGFPIATPTLLDQADAALLEKLGPDDAHRLRAIPLGHLAEGAVAVGLVEPADTEAV